MTYKVAMIIDEPPIPDLRDAFKEMGVDFIQKDCESDEEKIAVARDADFVLTVGHRRPITKGVIERLEKCKFIQTVGIGYDGLDIEAATQHGIGVMNVPDFCIEEMSDHVMALILACSRRIAHLDKVIKTGVGTPVERTKAIREVWSKLFHLRGETLGFIGFGRVARAVVPKARGFGMNITANDPHVPPSIANELAVPLVDIDQLLQDSDFVSINTALTPETRHLINLERLRKMKHSAFIINTARGPIIDNQALSVAVSKGYIAGAGLDVTDPEPIHADSPLLRLDNVILTGHSGHASPSSWAELWRRPLEQVAKVIRGEWPNSLLNPQVKQMQELDRE